MNPCSPSSEDQNDSQTRLPAQQVLDRFKHNRLAIFGCVVIVSFVVIIVATILIDIWTDYSFYEKHIVAQNLKLRLAKPSFDHIFGCDEFGRDLFLRLLWGTKYSFFIGVGAILLSTLIGVLLGMTAGYYGGRVDNAIMRVMDVFLSVPSMLLALAIVAALGTGTMNLMIALSVSGIARYARIARAAVLTVRPNEYIEAAEAAGANDFVILLRYILPNAMAPIIVQVTLGIGDSILAVAGMSYLGLGVQPPRPEWGAILTTAKTYMRDAWHISLFPGSFLIITVIAFNLFGDGLRDAMDPRLKR